MLRSFIHCIEVPGYQLSLTPPLSQVHSSKMEPQNNPNQETSSPTSRHINLAEIYAQLRREAAVNVQPWPC